MKSLVTTKPGSRLNNKHPALVTASKCSRAEAPHRLIAEARWLDGQVLLDERNGRFCFVLFQVHNMSMKRVNTHVAKTHLSRCNRIVPMGKPRIGAAMGKFVVPDSFFEPLPDNILKAFGEGRQVSRDESASRVHSE